MAKQEPMVEIPVTRARELRVAESERNKLLDAIARHHGRCRKFRRVNDMRLYVVAGVERSDDPIHQDPDA